ncbi:MAG: gamma-glutamylcyclotransferase [Pirellulales bacterium]|nr:gamma-glutamylcyclotransferase [Pirellulales bacterium]
MHLFAYGTLMFAEVWDRVVPRRFASQGGSVTGYRVRRAAGQLFPVMSRGEPVEQVPGLVYFDLDPETVSLLDEYESSLYDRAPVTVALDDGRTIECETYLLPDDRRGYASEQSWTAAWFADHGLAEYLRQW